MMILSRDLAKTLSQDFNSYFEKIPAGVRNIQTGVFVPLQMLTAVFDLFCKQK